MPMLHDLDLIQHTFPGDISIYPVADVHLGALEHAEAEWGNFLKRVEKENAFLILAGDLLNNNTRGVRFANPFDEVLRPREAKKRMVEYLEPIRDRILCVVCGNHEARTVRDSDQDLAYDICVRLDIEHLYRENIAYMCVWLGKRNHENNALQCYTFAVTHGSFGGQLTGGAVNKNERFGAYIDGMDCLITGHVHKGFISKPAKIVIDTRNKRVTMRHYTVVSAVSWLNYGGYAAKAMLTPAQVCDPQKLTLVASKDRPKIITTW